MPHITARLQAKHFGDVAFITLDALHESPGTTMPKLRLDMTPAMMRARLRQAADFDVTRSNGQYGAAIAVAAALM